MLSDWHVGSGLDAGADADLLVLKDENSLPYLSGKTIKGLLKNALLEMSELAHQSDLKDKIDKIFGKEVKKDDKIIGSVSGNIFFSNAYLNKDEQEEIITNNLSKNLYKNIASTAINGKGVAKKNSLRTMEVCVPVVLYGEIEGEEIDLDLLEKAFKWTRHLGVSRNRGLGRCKITKN